MKKNRKKIVEGFTLIELLVVISIIGILTSTIFVGLSDYRERARLAKSQMDLNAMRNAVELYASRHGYPEDEDRGVPTGMEGFLETGEWPKPAWDHALYDWDNWEIDGERVLQMSIRFCDWETRHNCSYPDFDWADDFDFWSAVYLCIDGPCRSHQSQPIDHPGYCVNCARNNEIEI